MSNYTHFHVSHGEVDLLAGDVAECQDCGRALYRAWVAVSLSHPDPSGGVNTAEAHLGLGRRRLPDDAEGADEGATVCDKCVARRAGPIADLRCHEITMTELNRQLARLSDLLERLAPLQSTATAPDQGVSQP